MFTSLFELSLASILSVIVGVLIGYFSGISDGITKGRKESTDAILNEFQRDAVGMGYAVFGPMTTYFSWKPKRQISAEYIADLERRIDEEDE